MKGGGRYFVKLKDLSSFAQRRINLVGVVVEFSVPRKSNGTDYCTVLKIIDQSQQSPEVTVNVFVRDIAGLPHIRSHKDIILLCNLEVEFFNQNFNAVYDHKASSFALFDGQITNDFTPYQVSPAYHSVPSDGDFIRRLRNWSQITPFDAGRLTAYWLGAVCAVTSMYGSVRRAMTEINNLIEPTVVLFNKVGEFELQESIRHKLIKDTTFLEILNGLGNGISEYAILLKDIKGRDFIDLVCTVLHVCEVSSGKWMLFVWDGTDAPALDLNVVLGSEELNPLPLQVEQNCLPSSVLCKFPRLGTVLRVMIDDTFENFGNHFRIVRDWVRIRNLHCRTVSGLWKGVMTPKTKIRHLSRNDDSVIRRSRDYKDRVSEHGYLPSCVSLMSKFLTEVPNHEQAKCTTLIELLTSPLVYGKFKCVVRFLAVYPPQAKDSQSSTGDYRMRITLEDPTARIHALLHSGDADEFFGGHLDIDELTIKMNKLLGIPEIENSSRNPPWTVCCVGFHSSNEDDVLGSRQFHLCDTKLLP